MVKELEDVLLRLLVDHGDEYRRLAPQTGTRTRDSESRALVGCSGADARARGCKSDEFARAGTLLPSPVVRMMAAGGSSCSAALLRQHGCDCAHLGRLERALTPAAPFHCGNMSQLREKGQIHGVRPPRRAPPPGRCGARWAGNDAEPRTVPECPPHRVSKTDEKCPVAMKFILDIWPPPPR